jgi:hypothetical protein
MSRSFCLDPRGFEGLSIPSFGNPRPLYNVETAVTSTAGQREGWEALRPIQASRKMRVFQSNRKSRMLGVADVHIVLIWQPTCDHESKVPEPVSFEGSRADRLIRGSTRLNLIHPVRTSLSSLPSPASAPLHQVQAHYRRITAGGFQLPSRIDGLRSFGQYIRIVTLTCFQLTKCIWCGEFLAKPPRKPRSRTRPFDYKSQKDFLPGVTWKVFSLRQVPFMLVQDNSVSLLTIL